ncbi:hypothetical protein HDA32_005751 [Spinactinospora alkalitolerans]|uniref:Uncharacterized protein n=1 Tax=Spinactinospora alkalitolerans TaxID=687207 RepID=A0A852U381_9ACTN|nr:hypothetical protein [Spinactinospora alkalitolerans]NYE50631.1 hypothetical protein [Spinactinospora alkalitolerans]
MPEPTSTPGNDHNSDGTSTNPAREEGMRHVSSLLTNLEQLIKTADKGEQATAGDPDVEWLNQVLAHAGDELRKTREHLFQEGLFGESKDPKLFF